MSQATRNHAPKASLFTRRKLIALGGIASVGGCVGALVHLSDAPAPERVDPAMLARGIDAAADYLVRHCRDDGAFDYRIHLDPGIEPRPAYNVLRHAGAIYSLTQAFERSRQPEVAEAITRASRHLIDTYIRPVPEQAGLVAAWSPPDEHDGEPELAKLGGAGLSLIALTAARSVDERIATPELLEGLGRFIVWMQKPDGSYYSKHIPSWDGRDDSWTSLYYPGEAALGLVRLNALASAPTFRAGAIDTLLFLERSRRGSSEIPADHWALLATAALWPTLGDDEKAKPAILSHAIAVTESILGESQPGPTAPVIGGGFDLDGRTTPTSTRLEGLIAMHAVLAPSDPDLARKIAARCSSGIGFLLRAQRLGPPENGAVPRNARFEAEAEDAAEDAGGEPLGRRAGEVRIDYVQHALSAMIQYEQAWVAEPT